MYKTAYSCKGRLAAVFFLSIAITGCSVVADYKKPVSDLQAAVGSSVNALNKIDKKATEAKNAQWRGYLLVGDGTAFLRTPDDSCSSGKRYCSVDIIYYDELGKERREPFPAQSIMPAVMAGLSGLKSYVDGLNEIMASDTVANVTTSANQALASAIEIENSVNQARKDIDPLFKTSPSVISGYSEPILTSIKWLVTQYVDTIKYRALAEATSNAQPVLVDLAELYEVIGYASSAQDESEAQREFTKANTAYDEAGGGKSAPVINTYLKAVANYNTALRASANNPLVSFIDAHTVLTNSLNGTGSATLADAINAIKILKTKAKEFKEVAENFSKINVN